LPKGGAAGTVMTHAMAMPAAAEEKNDSAEIPTKCVVTKLNLNLKAQIQYLDFEGLYDFSFSFLILL